MKNRNQPTFPTYHSNTSNSNNTNNTHFNNTTITNTNDRRTTVSPVATPRASHHWDQASLAQSQSFYNNNNSNNVKQPNTTYCYNQVTYTQQQQQQQQQQNQLFNHNQRQHSNRNRCQIIPPQQFLLPTQNQQRTSINPTNYQQQFLPTKTTKITKTTETTPTTMSSLTTSNFLQNQFANQQHFTPYLNQQHQQHTYQQQQQQQQYPNINRNQLIQQNQHQQQQMLQQNNQNQQQQQQQSELQFQRRQQLQLPLFSQNNVMQQFQQNHQQQRRQLFEQQHVGNTTINSLTPNNNNNNNNINNNNNKHTNLNNNNNSAPSNGNDNEKFSMDATEIANFLASELFMQQLVSVDGIQSGVPTLTTSTLTPTLLKSIEETFTQLIEEPIQAPFQAGFIPPTYPSTSNNTTNNIGDTFNGSLHDYIETESEDSRNSFGRPMDGDYALGGETTDNSSATTDSTSFQNGPHKSSFATSNSNSASTNDFSAINVAIAAAAGKKTNNANTSPSATITTTGTTTTRRNQGGRRPAKPSNLTPEEEEKRRVRRERNKLAAARCRKRRVDLTNELCDEVSLLEKKREGLQKDIATLNTQKQELEYILEAHRPNCQKIIKDLMSVTTFNGLIAPNTTTTNSNDSSGTITGIDTTLASTGRSSPLDLKPEIIHDNLLGITHIKNEPIDSTLDGNSLDHDGPASPKRMLLSSNNPMIPPPLPKIGTLSPSLAAASLNTPIVTTAPVSFASYGSVQNTNIVVNTLNAFNKPLLNVAGGIGGSKQRPTTLPTMPRNAGLGLNVDNTKAPPMDINGVAIQTPSTGMFNFDSLMDGGTGLTPVSGPLVPTCSSQNKHPLELTTPTSEPSKLVSL